jgi:hypothetical protein
MNNRMNEEMVETYRYPLLRNLFLLVLYVAFLIFLWHFPAPLIRDFFRTLFQSLLYVLAGVVLVGLTVLLFFTLLPNIELRTDVVESLEDLPERVLLEGRTLKVPALRDQQKHEQIGATLLDLSASMDVPWTAAVDDRAGVLTIFVGENSDIQWVVRTIQDTLRDAGFRAHYLK